MLTGAIEETPYAFNANEWLANDVDGEGDAFAVVAVQAIEGGTITWDVETGEGVFHPAPDFQGAAQLSYHVRDSAGHVSSAPVQILVANTDDAITVNSEQDQPTITLPTHTATMLPSEQLITNINNPDQDELTITAVRVVGEHGNGGGAGYARVLDSGDVLFSPLPEFQGAVTLEVRVSDGDRRLVNTVQLTVPEASVEEQTTTEETITEPETTQAAPTESSSDPTNDARVLEPSSMTNEPVVNSASVIARPDTFDDGVEETNYTVSVESILANVNDEPALNEQALTIDSNETTLFTQEQLLSQTVDADGETVSISAVTLRDDTAGTVALLDDGRVAFTPTADFTGDVALEITATDGVSPVRVTHTITVTHLNDAPTATVARLEDGLEDTVYELNSEALLVGARDEEGDAFALTEVRLVDESQATLEWDPQSGAVRIIPADNFYGEVSVEYVLTDERGAISTNTAAITLVNVNDTQTFENLDYRDPAYNLYEEEVRIFTREALLGGITHDADGEALTISAVTMADPSQGTVSVTSTGDVRFEPAVDVVGTAAFIVTVTDGVGTDRVDGGRALVASQ